MFGHSDIPVIIKYSLTVNIFIAELVLEEKKKNIKKVDKVIQTQGMSYELSFITFHFEELYFSSGGNNLFWVFYTLKRNNKPKPPTANQNNNNKIKKPNPTVLTLTIT